MVLQKRLEYGFNGFQVPPTPRAPRSARKRVFSRKKNEDHNRMCAFDLLATVAGKLLQEDDKFPRSETRTVKQTMIKLEQESSKENVFNQESCNKSFFVSEIISKPLITDTSSGPASGITVSDSSPKVPRSVNGEIMISDCIENINNKRKTEEVIENFDSNVNLDIRDDDENSCGSTQPQTLNNKPTRIGDRRLRRLSASKQWKVAPKLNDDSELKPVYRSKNDQRSLRDYPFKKRRLYQLDNPSDSNEISGSPRNGSIEDDSNSVKLKIKSFRVPEFFIEMPETATVSSLKRTVMEAVTAIFSGELHVGVMLQGKRIRDDNITLMQTGICHDNKLDALGFTLEPNDPFLCPEDPSVVPPPPDIPKLLDFPMKKMTEHDHDSVDHRIASYSRALVTVPPVNAVVPMRKSKRAEVAQRRIRRPFAVSEVEALVEAVEKLGTGRWRDVKLRAFDDAKHRTYVDLKDKWKTLVHTARISPHQRRGEPVPQELLDRVLTAHGYWSHHQAKNQFKHHSIQN